MFSKIIAPVIERFDINIGDVFLDDTKFEANANKFKYVWKPTTFHAKLNAKVKDLLCSYIQLPSSKKQLHVKGDRRAPEFVNCGSKGNGVRLGGDKTRKGPCHGAHNQGHQQT